MNSCISEKVYNRYIEDELSEEELVRLKSHADDCPICHAEFEKWKALKVSLGETLEVKMPDSLKGKIMTGIRSVNIIPAPQPLGFKRTMTSIMLLLLTVAYYFFPFLKPYTDEMTNELLAYISELGYSMLSFAGIDIKTVFAFYKAFISLFSNFYIIFASGTLMLVVGFILLILKGNTKLKAN